MTPSIQEIEIGDDLKKCGVTRFVKENGKFLIECDDRANKKAIILFNSHKTLLETLEDFQVKSKARIDRSRQQAIMFVLSSEKYINILLNGGTICIDTNKPNEKEYSTGVDEMSAAAIPATVDATRELDPHIPDKQYVEFVIGRVKKTVKQEDSLIRQVLYVGLSAYMHDPINLGVIAPTSEGKTYPIIEALGLFPKEDIWLIGSMSTKLLVRQRGILVDDHNEPINPRIKELTKQIRKTNDEDEKERLKNRLQELNEDARQLIDLSGKTLVFLEPPQSELWNLLKPILSHDSKEIEFPFVDKTDTGLIPRRVIVKGWPACIFCSAKDESNWPVWPEIQSRFLITSPNMIPLKYLESNLLSAQKKGLPRHVQKQIIISDEEIELAKKCVLYLKQQIQIMLKNGDKAVWIPYHQYLAEILPSNKGTDTRALDRIFSFLNIIPLAKANCRPKLVYASEIQVVASLEDLGEVLHITQNLNGMPTYKAKFFSEVFCPLYETKGLPLTTRELCDRHEEVYHKGIDTDNMKKKYLNELRNNGLIGEEDSDVDKRCKVYVPLVQPLYSQDKAKEDYEETSNYTKLSKFDNFFHLSKIIIPSNCKYIPESWLLFEVLTLIKCRIDHDKSIDCLSCFLNDNTGLMFLDKQGNRVTIIDFITEYEKSLTLSRYFTRRGYHKFHSIMFGDMQYIEMVGEEKYGILPTQNNFLKFDISEIGDSHIDNKTTTAVASIPALRSNKIKEVEDFFYDTPGLFWPSSPEHDLNASPCYSIIGKKDKFYYCKLHPQIKNIHLDSIENHCKYKEPDMHRSAVLRSLGSDAVVTNAAAATG